MLNRQKQQAAAQAAAVQKAAQPQQTQAAVQQKVAVSQCDSFFLMNHYLNKSAFNTSLFISVQLGTQQAAQTTGQQQQKVYTATTPLQPAIKTQFFTTSIGQPQKPAQQIQVRSWPCVHVCVRVVSVPSSAL